MIERERIKDAINLNPNTLIDVHSHCGFGQYNVIKRRYPSSQSVIDLASKTKSAGIEYAVSFPFPGSSYYFDIAESAKGNLHVPNPIEEFPYHFANRQLFYEVSLFGDDRILPFANIYPKYEEQKQADYLEQLAKEKVLFGLKLHTLATQSSASSLKDSPFLEIADHYSLPILVHSGPDEISYPMHIVKLAEQYASVRFCIAHAARFEKKIFDHITENKIKNVFVDTSPFISLAKLTPLDVERNVGNEKLSLPYGNPKLALLEFCQLFPDIVVWGTDEPWTTITDDHRGDILLKATYKDEVNLLQSLPESVKKKISHENTNLFLFGK